MRGPRAAVQGIAAGVATEDQTLQAESPHLSLSELQRVRRQALGPSPRCRLFDSPSRRAGGGWTVTRACSRGRGTDRWGRGSRHPGCCLGQKRTTRSRPPRASGVPVQRAQACSPSWRRSEQGAKRHSHAPEESSRFRVVWLLDWDRFHFPGTPDVSLEKGGRNSPPLAKVARDVRPSEPPQVADSTVSQNEADGRQESSQSVASKAKPPEEVLASDTPPTTQELGVESAAQPVGSPPTQTDAGSSEGAVAQEFGP